MEEVFFFNPSATSYVPLSKRDAEKDFNPLDDEPPPHHDDEHLVESKTKCVPENELEWPDKDDAIVDIEYMKIAFPGIHEQSLIDVYLVNDCVLDDAIDMLNQLECDDVVSLETHDTGNVSVSAPEADSASLKPKITEAQADIAGAQV